MIQKDLVDLTYDIVLNNLQSKKDNNSGQSIDFATICKELKNNLPNLSNSEFDKLLGSLYTDLLQDNRFIFLRDNKWTLRELNNLDFLRKNQSLIYNYDSSIKFEEVYDEESLPEEIVNAKNEVYDESDNEISRDSFDINDNSSNTSDSYDDSDYDDDEI